jgi:hypothetical protein
VLLVKYGVGCVMSLPHAGESTKKPKQNKALLVAELLRTRQITAQRRSMMSINAECDQYENVAPTGRSAIPRKLGGSQDVFGPDATDNLCGVGMLSVNPTRVCQRLGPVLWYMIEQHGFVPVATTTFPSTASERPRAWWRKPAGIYADGRLLILNDVEQAIGRLPSAMLSFASSNAHRRADRDRRPVPGQMGNGAVVSAEAEDRVARCAGFLQDVPRPDGL